MKPKKNVTSIYLPDDLRAKLQARAAREGRSFSNLVTQLLAKEVKKETKAACTG